MPVDHEPTMTRGEFCALFNISKRTAHRWANRGYGPRPVHCGGRGPADSTRYRTAEVQVFLEQRGVRARYGARAVA